MLADIKNYYKGNNAIDFNIKWNELATMSRSLFNMIYTHSLRWGDFVLSSGQRSDVYLDLKPVMLSSDGIYLLTDLLNVNMLLENEKLAVKNPINAIGGLELGAVPLITPMLQNIRSVNNSIFGFIVRKDVKDHGTKRLVESAEPLKGMNVVVLEDVTTTRASAMQAVDAVEAQGANVLFVMSIVDRCEKGALKMSKLGNFILFSSLFNLSEFREFHERKTNQ